MKKKEKIHYHEPVKRIRIKPKSNDDLICKYCGKALHNSNAHSGHITRCSKMFETRIAYRKENRHIFTNPNEAKRRWNSLDHGYFQLFEYETKYSEEAIQFIVNQLYIMNEFPKNRLKEYCFFYLVVLAQIVPDPKIREQAFGYITVLADSNEISTLKKFWKSLGNRRYEPSAESYSKIWEKFIRIKDECFFNVDFPIWVLLLDRYVLTYKLFGWHENNIRKDSFRDVLYENMIQLMYVEQDYLGIPGSFLFYTNDPEEMTAQFKSASEIYQYNIPDSVILSLHSSSRKRFSKEKNYHKWYKLSEMDYDPRNPESANLI